MVTMRVLEKFNERPVSSNLRTITLTIKYFFFVVFSRI